MQIPLFPRGAVYILFGADSNGGDPCSGDWNIDDHLMFDGTTTGLRAARFQGDAMNTKTGSGISFIPDTDGDGLNDVLSVRGAMTRSPTTWCCVLDSIIQTTRSFSNEIINDVAHLRLHGGIIEARLAYPTQAEISTGMGWETWIVSRDNPDQLVPKRGTVQVVYGRDIPIASSTQMIDLIANLSFHGESDNDKAVMSLVLVILMVTEMTVSSLRRVASMPIWVVVYLVPGFYETAASYTLSDTFNPATGTNAQSCHHLRRTKWRGSQQHEGDWRH